ncbi:hypothetical protein LCGC14_2926660, partial [marine sediment metagenome]
YIYNYTGYCSRMDEIQAAVLNVKLEYINEIINSHREAAFYYNKCLEGVCSIPFVDKGMFHTYHKYIKTILCFKLQMLNILSITVNGLQPSLE